MYYNLDMFEKPPRLQEEDLTTKIEIQKKKAEQGETPTKSFEKFTKEMLWDFALLKDKKQDYEPTMEDINSIYELAEKTGSDKNIAEANQQIRAKWVPIARKTLTEWIDAEIKFKEKYSEEVRVELDNPPASGGQRQTSLKYDALASEYGITEYSP